MAYHYYIVSMGYPARIDEKTGKTEALGKDGVWRPADERRVEMDGREVDEATALGWWSS